MLKVLFAICFLWINFFTYSQEFNFQKELDSIQLLRKLSQSSEIEPQTTREYAERASALSYELEIDSIIIKSNLNLALNYLNLDYYDTFEELNKSIIQLSEKTKDSSSVVHTAHANYNLGWYYQIKSKQDSAYFYYFQARKLYHTLKDKKNEAEVLVNMISIQSNAKDFVGAENNAIEAIKILKELPKTPMNLSTMWSLHNSIGSISKELGLYENSIDYYEQSLDYVKGFSDYNLYESFIQGNIATVYIEMGKYKEVLKITKELLRREYIKQDDPEFYAAILINQAIAKYKSDQPYVFEDVENQFEQSLSILKNYENFIDIGIVEFDFAEFYYSQNEYELANIHLDKSLKINKETSNYDYLLRTLELKSRLDKGEAGKLYLNDYIKLNDSLIKVERAMRNKFARIEFETDTVIAENEQISKERLIFLFSSIGLMALLILIYIIITQRAKNQELRFIQQQQETNEEIYNLMLAQQDKIDEGRAEEKKRISQELHDGILGRLFGTRLSLDSLNMVNSEEAIKNRGDYINQLKTIETDIRKISHDLNADFISESGFIDIIKALIESQTKAYKLTFDFKDDAEIDWDHISNKNKIHIYRMLQESMQNIYKHAKASHIKIGFEQKNSLILFSIQDDGVGFNTAKARKGIGLKNIDARVRELGGKAEIFSKVGQGTKIKISIPVKEA